MNSKHLVFSFLCFSYLWLFSSCYDESNTLGESLTSTSFRNISIDTCTVIASADKIDSLETSGKGLALLGQYKNPIWGTMQAHAIIPYIRPAYSEESDKVVTLDSLVLTLHYNGYSIGDTTQFQEITVHELAEKVDLNDNGYIYSHTAVAYDSEPLATCRFVPHPSVVMLLKSVCLIRWELVYLHGFTKMTMMYQMIGLKTILRGFLLSPTLN